MHAYNSLHVHIMWTYWARNMGKSVINIQWNSLRQETPNKYIHDVVISQVRATSTLVFLRRFCELHKSCTACSHIYKWRHNWRFYTCWPRLTWQFHTCRQRLPPLQYSSVDVSLLPAALIVWLTRSWHDHIYQVKQMKPSAIQHPFLGVDEMFRVV